MSDVPPPGWYPDPADATQQRYWDGSAWTEHTGGASAKASVGASPAAAGGAIGGGAGGSGTVNTWTWQSILVTFLCCGGVFSIVGIFQAGKAEGALKAGNVALAREHAAKARTWTLVGLGLGVLAVVAVVGVFGAALSQVGSAFTEGCDNAAPGTAQYEFCTGLCAEDVQGSPFESMCDEFTR